MIITVRDLILELEKYNAHARVSINCPDTNATRNIWYVTQDEDPEHMNNFIDIVMTSEKETLPDKYQAITNDNADYFIQGEEDERNN